MMTEHISASAVDAAIKHKRVKKAGSQLGGETGLPYPFQRLPSMNIQVREGEKWQNFISAYLPLLAFFSRPK